MEGVCVSVDYTAPLYIPAGQVASQLASQGSVTYSIKEQKKTLRLLDT